MTEPLTIERYAAVVAHLRYFRGRDSAEVLRLLEEDPARFAASDPIWSSALLADAEEERSTPRVIAFGAAYDATLRRLRRERPSLPEPSGLPAGAEVAVVTSGASGLAPGELSLEQLTASARPRQPPALAPPSAPAADDLDMTSEQALPNLAPVLPFGGVRSPEFLARLVRPVAREDGRPRATRTVATEEVDVARLQSLVHPFARRSAGAEERDVGAPSALSLEQYATLRARLLVAGEDDAEVWSGFGITSSVEKDALRARFAERFRRDPHAQRRFVELVQEASASLRSRR